MLFCVFHIIHSSSKEKEMLCVYTIANFSIAYEKLKFITITKKKHVANTTLKKVVLYMVMHYYGKFIDSLYINLYHNSSGLKALYIVR